LTILLALLLQTWHELKFDLGGPEDIEAFPWSVPVSMSVTVLIVLLVWRARRTYMALPELPAVGGNGEADVTAVIPARDQERTIRKCIQSLKPTRVIVVDEGSQDRTGAEAKAAGAEVIGAPAAPRGVQPRPNAMCAGEQLATSNYVVFADGDTWYAPNFIASAARYASENELVLLTPYLKQQCGTLVGKVVTPFAHALHFCSINARHAQDVLLPGTYANGQCMFFLRSAYEFFGGYRSVQTSPIEDVAIAQKVKRHRMKIRLMRAEHLGSVQREWSRRNALRVLRPGGKLGILVVLTAILLVSIVPLAAWLAWQEQWPFLPLLLLAPVLVFAPWYGGWRGALLYLPAAYLFALFIVRDYFGSVFGSKNV